MRKRVPLRTLYILLFLAGACLVRLGAVIAEPPTPDTKKADQLREDLRQMIELARDRVFPALVNIHVVSVNYYDGKEHKSRSIGSGTIVSAEGYVVTNYHVTSKGKKFKCTLSDKQEISATLIGEDPLTDIAVIKLNLAELKSPASQLPVAKFGNSDDLQVGDHVMAMGSPLALSRSVTLGIVSNTERVFAGSSEEDAEDMELEEGQRTGLFTRWIQHDSLIHPGNSGGPLVNLKGEIVGINELGGNSMGFAIPSNLAKLVADGLIKDKAITRSWIGVSFKPIEKTGYDKGVLVNSVVKAGPADQAGVKAGDVLLLIDGQSVTVRFPEEIPPLMKRIAEVAVGATIRVAYEREGKPGQAEITTLKLEKDRGDEASLRSWGITVEEITERMFRENKFETREGAYISSVRTGGPGQLAEPAIVGGDVLKSIDGEKIGDLHELIKVYEKIMQSDPLPENLLIEFNRSGKSHLTLLKPKLDENEPPPREVAKAWIGVATQPIIDKLAKKLGHPDDLGYRITRIYPNTDAASSPLKVGDIITSLNGEKLRPRGMQDSGLFARAVRKLKIDESAELTVLRDKSKEKLTVKLERTRLTPEEARRARNQDFELTVRELTFFDRDDHRWDETVEGVLVESAESAGWAGLGGLQSDDLILKINQHEIKDLKAYKKAMKAIAKEQPQRVVFVVLRGVQTRFQFVEPEWKPNLPEDDKKAPAN
ncbi:MAG: PDZ domain-containing protein [Planctomycetota bacterium]